MFTQSAMAQVVDKVRLSYDSLKVSSRQSAVAASGDGQYLAFAYEDRTVKVFDVAANKFVASFESTSPRLFDIKLTQKGERLVLLGDSTVQIHDWRRKQNVATFSLPATVSKVVVNLPRNLLAVGMKGGRVQIYDLEALRLVRTIENEGQQVSVLAISPDGKKLVVGSMKKFYRYRLRLYEIVSGQLLATSSKAIYTSAFFNEDGTSLVTATIQVSSREMRIMNVALVLGEIAYFMYDFEQNHQPEYDADGNNVNEVTALHKTVELGIYGLIGAHAIWSIFKSRTIVKTLGATDLKRIDKISSTDQAKVTYYLQGTVHDSLALMMTHTQSFDVFNTTTSKKVFTTTEDRKSYKASLDYLGTDHARIYPLGDGSKYLINTYGNNINQIYDAATNAIVGYVFSDSNEDFAVISRDGRVDGTQAALSKVFWTSKNSAERTPLESNFEYGFTPRLLEEIAHGKMLGREFDIDEINSRIPSIRVQSINGVALPQEPLVFNQKQVQIVVQAHDNPQEVTEVRLFQNGKLVGTSPRSASGTYEFSATLSNSFGEDNYFYCTAQSKSNIESQKQKFVLRYQGVTEAPTLYLVTVGINQYLNSKYNLNYARPDADSLEQSVKQTTASLISNIVTYSIRDDQAVKTKIAEVVNEISIRAREQDILWFYYAGHGVLSERNGNEEFYIVPHDVTQLYGKEDVLRDKAISAAELKAYSQSIKAQKQIFILDACHSGGALTDASSRGGGAEERAIAQMARSTGSFWLTSSGSDQFATELQKLGHGIFTYALLEGLKGKADANKDQKLTVRELSTYVEDTVPELSEKYKGVAQYPSGYSFGNDFPIAVYK